MIRLPGKFIAYQNPRKDQSHHGIDKGCAQRGDKADIETGQDSLSCNDLKKFSQPKLRRIHNKRSKRDQNHDTEHGDRHTHGQSESRNYSFFAFFHNRSPRILVAVDLIKDPAVCKMFLLYFLPAAKIVDRFSTPS